MSAQCEGIRQAVERVVLPSTVPGAAEWSEAFLLGGLFKDRAAWASASDLAAAALKAGRYDVARICIDISRASSPRLCISTTMVDRLRLLADRLRRREADCNVVAEAATRAGNHRVAEHETIIASECGRVIAQLEAILKETTP